MTGRSTSRANGGHDWTIEDVGPAVSVIVEQAKHVQDFLQGLNAVLAELNLDHISRDQAKHRMWSLADTFIDVWDTERKKYAEALRGDQASDAEERVRRTGEVIPGE